MNVRRFRVVPSSEWVCGTINVDQTSFLKLPDKDTEWTFVLQSPGTWIVGSSFLDGLFCCILQSTTIFQHEIITPAPLSLPPGRVQNIFDTAAPLTIVISSDPKAYRTSLSAALRISHSLDVYLKLGSEILLDIDAIRILEAIQGGSESDHLRGNLVVLGGIENALSKRLLRVPESELKTALSLSESGSWLFRGQPLNKGDDSDLGILFTHPHPTNPSGISVFLSGTSASTPSSDNADAHPEGFERVLRLFVPRTGIAVPDWIIVGKEVDELGAGGVVGAG